MSNSKQPLVNFEEIVNNMKMYPISFLAYVVPALFAVLLGTFLVNYFNNLDLRDYETISMNLIKLLVILILYFICDSFVANFVYSQFKHKKKLLETLIISIKNFHIYIFQRFYLLLLLIMPSTLVFTMYYLLIIPFIKMIDSESLLILIIALFMLLIIIGSFLIGIYLYTVHAYLPVSTHFSKSKKVFQFREYKKVVQKKRKNIIIRMLILLAIISTFQLGYMIYDILISYIPQNIVSLIFQGIGIFITMGISYFSNTYLFYTYKKLIGNK